MSLNYCFIVVSWEVTIRGAFSDEAFFGEVTDVNVWDKTLTDIEIKAATATCGHAAQGNVVSWRDMSMADLVGTSTQIPSLCDGTSLNKHVSRERILVYVLDISE